MHDKPWLTPEQQIEHLERKGVAFNLMSKQEALSYLKHNNNYFRLRSYNVQYDVRNAVTGLKLQDVNVKAELSNDRLQHIATTLYLHSTMASIGVRSNKGKQLRRLAERMYRNESYYLRNDQIRTGFAFISGLINGWFVNQKIVSFGNKTIAIILTHNTKKVDTFLSGTHPLGVSPFSFD